MRFLPLFAILFTVLGTGNLAQGQISNDARSRVRTRFESNGQPVQRPPYVGTVRGHIIDPTVNEPLTGATVTIDSLHLGAQTDLDGYFEINQIPVGLHRIKVQMISYEVYEVYTRVEIGQTTVLDIELVSVSEGEDVVITGARNTGGEMSLVTEIREAEQVVSGVSSEQIARTQDRDAGQVVRRVPGVTIVNNRFIVIRGLNERYNLTMLNGALVPSSENDQKAFAFDLIPSQMIDRMLIYKSGAPELPGEFAGGVVQIFTKAPLENSLQISYTAGIRSGTTGQDMYFAERGPTDWLGFGAGHRALPGGFPDNLNNFSLSQTDQVTAASRLLPNNWALTRSTAIPDQRLNISLTRVRNGAKLRFGNLTALNYSNSFQRYNSDRNFYNARAAGSTDAQQVYAFQDEQFENTIRLGIMHNWFWVWGNGAHRIEFRHFLNQLANEQTTRRTGVNFEAGQEQNNRQIRHLGRTIYMGQLYGKHKIANARHTLEWAVGAGLANRNEPDLRRAKTQRPIGADTAQFTVTLPPGASNTDASRFWSHASEMLTMSNGEYEFQFRLPDSSEVTPAIKAGYYFERKTREFSARWMAFAPGPNFNEDISGQSLDEIFGPQNIDYNTGLTLREGTNPSDHYTATNVLGAGYVTARVPFGHGRFLFNGGARIEYNSQTLESALRTGTVGSNAPVSVELVTTRVLPAMNLSYNITPKALVRAAYYQSLNRPEFRELAPFAYYDFQFNNVVIGNPDLETPSIHNGDLRLEYYPAPGEMITIGGFAKQFTNPIEMLFVPGAGSLGTQTFTFGNAETAYSIGAEVEARKNLAFITPKLKNLSVLVNGAWIKSSVRLGDQAARQSDNRPLMGQSPYMMNAGLFYQNDRIGLQANVMYNVFGKRIFAVGSLDIPDLYEMPRHLIDLSIRQRITPWLSANFGIQDILNQPVRFLQDADRNNILNDQDETLLEYRLGQYFTAGFSVNL